MIGISIWLKQGNVLLITEKEILCYAIQEFTNNKLRKGTGT